MRDERTCRVKRKQVRLYGTISGCVLILLLGIYCVTRGSKRSHDSSMIHSYSCQALGLTTFDALPEEIQRFHHDTGMGEIVKITWFSCPYPGFYYTLVFHENKAVTHWREVPDWAIQGGAEGVLSDAEYASLQENLTKITENKVLVSDNKGNYLVTLSFYINKTQYSLVCTEQDCTPEVGALFTLAGSIFRRKLVDQQEVDGFMDGTPFSHASEN